MYFCSANVDSEGLIILTKWKTRRALLCEAEHVGYVPYWSMLIDALAIAHRPASSIELGVRNEAILSCEWRQLHLDI